LGLCVGFLHGSMSSQLPGSDPSISIACCSSADRSGVLRGRMFPNVRLQIVALFVSVVALSFGFGVFAAFRVNHEPLAPIPASAVPLPLGAENTAPSSTPTSWGAPFGSRFWLSETQIHGAADLPALTPVVRNDVTGRTVTWIVVTRSVAGANAPALQPPPALTDAQSVEAPLAPKQGDATEEAAAPVEGAAPAPAAVVGAAEPTAQVQPEVTSTVPESATQELKALPKVPVHAGATPPHRRVAARVPLRPQARVQSAGQREEPVVFQTAPPPYRPQKGTSVARSGSRNSTSDVPVFQTAPPSQR